MGWYDPPEDDWEIPEKYCTCWYCENFDASWMVCKLACKRNGIVAKTIKEFDAILYAMDEDSEEYKAIARNDDDCCEDYEPDYSSISEDADPYDDEPDDDYDPFYVKDEPPYPYD